MLRLRTFGVKGIEIAYSSAAVGDILCSDMKIVSAANYSASGKTAIGIVIYNASGVLKAVSLAETGSYFSSYGSNIPGLTDFEEMDSALTDLDGRANTSIIITALGSYAYAATYCRSFTTTGTQAGDWDLPALGELNYIKNQISLINASLQTVSGTPISTTSATLGGADYVSSTEYNSTYIWVLSALVFPIKQKSSGLGTTVRPITKITY